MKEASALYLKRKLGEKMKFKYKVGVFLPALLILLITSLLVFMLIFIVSMSTSIDRSIALLGSGSLTSSEFIPHELLPEGSEENKVYSAEGLLYSENSASITYLKGVELSSYFDLNRKDAFRLERIEGDGKNPIYLSSTLARELKTQLGDRMTMLLYEEDKNRTRPLLVTVEGIFDTGYAQLDKYLAFIPSTLVLNNPFNYEILLSNKENVDNVKKKLLEEGYYTSSYKENYRSLYTNVSQSIAILYVILVAVAFLSAFFSSDIAQIYISRDREDIASLRLLGFESKEIRKIYTRMTLLVLLLAILLGVCLGIVLGAISPQIVKGVSIRNPELLDNYITNFSIKIPIWNLLIMIAVMILISYITLIIYLRHLGEVDISKLIVNE